MMKIHRYLSSERKTRHGMRLSILPGARAIGSGESSWRLTPPPHLFKAGDTIHPHPAA
jgi:hypothetical protein